MIIIDNSVLSAFTRLNLLEELEILFKIVYTTKSIINEYSSAWSSNLPKFIEIADITNNLNLPTPPGTLSLADLTLIKLSLNKSLPIASDDLPLRKYSKLLNIKITGSIGILRVLWDKQIIYEKEKFIQLVNDLQKDLYLTDDLRNWALRGIE